MRNYLACTWKWRTFSGVPLHQLKISWHVSHNSFTSHNLITSPGHVVMSASSHVMCESHSGIWSPSTRPWLNSKTFMVGFVTRFTYGPRTVDYPMDLLEERFISRSVCRSVWIVYTSDYNPGIQDAWNNQGCGTRCNVRCVFSSQVALYHLRIFAAWENIWINL